MQYCAFSLAHFKRDAIYKVGSEAVREAAGYKNNVDAGRTGQNYFASSGELLSYYKARGGELNHRKMVEDILDQYTHIEQRKARGTNGGRPRKVRVYNDNGKMLKSNVNWMSGFVVTLQRETVQEWGEDRAREYFKAVSDWFEKRYGNRVSDAVHMDEDNPHMQYYFVPTKNGHLDTDGIFDRAEMRKLHNELPAYLRRLGFDVQRGVHNGKKKYVQKMDELKRKTAQHASLVIKGVDDCIDIFNNAEEKKAGFWDKVMGNDNTHYLVDKGDFLKLVDTAKVSVAAVAEAEAEKNRADAAVREASKMNDLRVRADERAEKADADRVLARQALDAVVNRYMGYEHTVKQLDELAGGDVGKLLEDYDDMQQQLDAANGRIKRMQQLREQEREQEREKYRKLEQQLKKQQAAHEQLQKDFKNVDGIADQFFDILKRYPSTMGSVLQKYANAIGRSVKYTEDGVCIGFAQCKVREIER